MWADYECEDDADDELGASTHAVCAIDIYLFNNEAYTLKEILLLKPSQENPELELTFLFRFRFHLEQLRTVDETE